MSTTKSTLFLNLVTLLKYLTILLCLISLPKIKSSSELIFKLKYVKINNNEEWPKILEDEDNKFKNPSSYKINGVQPRENKYSNAYCNIDNGQETTVTLTFNEKIDSYEKMFYGRSGYRSFYR